MTQRAAWSFMLFLLCLMPAYAQDTNTPQDVLSQTYTEVATLGRGALLWASWHPDGSTILVNSTQGADLYNTDFELLHHFEGAHQAAFSPDGQLLATATRDPNELNLWDAQTNRLIKTIALSSSPSEYENTLAWSPDGSHIAIGLGETVKVIEVASWQTITSMDAEGRITYVSWRPDGQRLAVARAAAVLIVDPVQGEIERQIDIENGATMALWSPDQKTLATIAVNTYGSWNINAVKLWDTETGMLRLVIQAPYTETFAWSPDSQTIATGSYTDQGYSIFGVSFWTAQTGEQIGWLPYYEYQKPFTSIAWNATGTQVMMTAEDNLVRVFEWPLTFETQPRELAGYQGPITGIAWNGDGTQIIASSEDSGLHIWDVTSGKAIQQLTTVMRLPSDVDWNKTQSQIAYATEFGMVYAWDFLTGEPINGFVSYGREYPTVVAYSPDGRILASAGFDETGGQVTLSLVNTEHEPLKTLARLDRLDRPVWSLSWSANSQYLAYNNGAAYIYDVTHETTQKFDCRSDTENTIVDLVSLSPDGRRLATSDGRLCLWDVETATPIVLDYSKEAPLAGVSPHKMIWNPDGTRLATLTNMSRYDADTQTHYSEAAVWDVATHTALMRVEMLFAMTDIAWSPDGTQLATGGYDGLIRIWQQE